LYAKKHLGSRVRTRHGTAHSLRSHLHPSWYVSTFFSQPVLGSVSPALTKTGKT
jgi:hypothetical protein